MQSWLEGVSIYTSVFTRLLLSSVSSSLNTRTQSHAARASHCITPLHVSQMTPCASIMSCSKPSPDILVQVDLNFSRPKSAFQEVLWLLILILDVFLARLNLALFAVWCINPLCLLWWGLLLIVDFDSDTSASWRVFLLSVGCCERVFLRSSPQLSSVDVQVLLYYWAHQYHHSHFLRMYQTVDLATPNVPAMSLMISFVFEA